MTTSSTHEGYKITVDQSAEKGYNVDKRTRAFWLSVRQALLILLGALEDYLEMPRSVVPKHRK